MEMGKIKVPVPWVVVRKQWQNQLSVVSTFTFVLFDNTVVAIADKQ